jgi:hypothetical protein
MAEDDIADNAENCNVSNLFGLAFHLNFSFLPKPLNVPTYQWGLPYKPPPLFLPEILRQAK